MDLSGPGAGLRNVEMPIAEIESIFDSIFAGDQANRNEDGNCNGTINGLADGDSPSVDMVQVYGCHEDVYVPFHTDSILSFIY